jgi:hypothetical protein
MGSDIQIYEIESERVVPAFVSRELHRSLCLFERNKLIVVVIQRGSPIVANQSC